MRTLLSATFLSLALCGFCPAQSSQAAQPNNGGTATPQNGASSAQPTAGQNVGPRKLASGSVIPVLLTKTIDAKKAKSGDAVEAKVTQDLKNQAGDVLLPKDTKISGHITEAQARNKEQSESQLGIAFDRASIRNGADMQLPMSIQAIIAPPSTNANNSDNTAPASSPSGGMCAGGRTPGMNGSAPPNPGASEGRNLPQDNNSPSNSQRPPINGNTQGVVGFSNLTLAPAQNPAQGSIVGSEKGNVKLESGTFLLLHVN